MSKVSVIVPVYKAERTLARCVDSILAQTYTDFELLLIDDGSPDNSSVLCDKYAKKDPRIRVFHKDNGGVSSARNLGLDNAQGEWISFVDSDDYVYSNWLQNFINILSKNSNTSTTLCVQNIEYVPSNHYINNSEQTEDFTAKTDIGLSILYDYCLKGYLVNKLFSSNIIHNHDLKFNIDYNYWEDEEFISRYCRFIDEIIYTKEKGYVYYLPDFENKYVIKKNMYSLLSSMWENYYYICGNNYLSRVYLNDLTDELFNSYSQLSKSESKKLLKQYKELVRYNVLNTRLFFLTKWIIYINPILTFSDYYLRTYIKLHKFFFK